MSVKRTAMLLPLRWSVGIFSTSFDKLFLLKKKSYRRRCCCDLFLIYETTSMIDFTLPCSIERIWCINNKMWFDDRRALWASKISIIWTYIFLTGYLTLNSDRNSSGNGLLISEPWSIHLNVTKNLTNQIDGTSLKFQRYSQSLNSQSTIRCQSCTLSVRNM